MPPKTHYEAKSVACRLWMTRSAATWCESDKSAGRRVTLAMRADTALNARWAVSKWPCMMSGCVVCRPVIS